MSPGVKQFGGPSAWTVSGYFKSSAQNGRSSMWQPMSPSRPLPKSHQLRQATGW